MGTSAAISVGRAEVGSTRVTSAGVPRWLFAAEGEPVVRASALVRAAPVGEVLVADDAAALVSDRFTSTSAPAPIASWPPARTEDDGAALHHPTGACGRS